MLYSFASFWALYGGGGGRVNQILRTRILWTPRLSDIKSKHFRREELILMEKHMFWATVAVSPRFGPFSRGGVPLRPKLLPNSFEANSVM